MSATRSIRRRLPAAVLVVVLVAACGPAKKAPPQGCSRFVGVTGQVQSNELTEISGIEASTVNPGVLWAHNDSGDSARVFAMAGDGRHLGWFGLAGAANVDWEALALGPGPVAGQSYLYAGDIGDNNHVRSSIVVYRVAEPAVDVNNPPGDGQTLGGVETFTLTYPDGAHDAEALLVDPATGDVVIVTKELSGPAGVYVRPAPISNGPLTKHADLGVSLVTAGDITADGGTVALRTYGSVLLFTRAPGSSVASALQSAPCTGASAPEPQGEAITFSPDGQAYATISEGVHPPINLFSR
ncbi:MAG TPA: hypothetical protein VMQ81_06670 [Acidimicrobiia bacterium]|nr:hypothetical protein [Acidimicrobiia bacterium]